MGIDHIDDLIDYSIKNLQKTNKKDMEKGIIKMICEDGRKGCLTYGPFDVIHVGAYSEIVPQLLLD